MRAGTATAHVQPRRILLACLLVTALFGLSVHYDAREAAHSPYPTVEELRTDYDSHVGERAFLGNEVVAADPDNGTMTVVPSRSYPSFTMRVEGAARTVPPGGNVQVYGRLAPGRTVVADRVVAVNASRSAELYKYATSVLGAVLVLVAFFARWRVDRRTVAFEVRDG